jgi:uncharacterized protein (DUF4415 family)
MKKVHTRTSSAGRRLAISEETRALYKRRDKNLDNADPDAPVLPPEMWDGALIGKYYRPLKTQISLRVDNDVLAWLKSKGAGYLSRINRILRETMEVERSRKEM